jgi:hypothetical protein
MDASIIDKNCCVVRWSLLGEFDGGFPSGSQQRWDCKPVQVTKPGRSNDSFIVIWNVARSVPRFGSAVQRMRLWRLTKDVVVAMQPSES